MGDVKDAKDREARPQPPRLPQPQRLPQTRPELLALHHELRRQRDAVPLESHERARLAGEVARVEVEIARLERSMDPPRV